MKNKTIKNILTYYKAKTLTKTILRYNNKLGEKKKNQHARNISMHNKNITLLKRYLN